MRSHHCYLQKDALYIELLFVQIVSLLRHVSINIKLQAVMLLCTSLKIHTYTDYAISTSIKNLYISLRRLYALLAKELVDSKFSSGYVGQLEVDLKCFEIIYIVFKVTMYNSVSYIHSNSFCSFRSV